MILHAWLDGERVLDSEHAVALTNRGLHYGDGLFETMLLRAGKIRFLQTHLQRAEEGCRRLHMAAPTSELLQDLRQLPDDPQPCIVKLLLVRSGTARGYRPALESRPLRLLLLYPWSEAPATLRVQWCSSRWSSNTQLAGLKHLNRLEQVLAQQELGATSDEGLMLDGAGELISATSGNVFLVTNGNLRTPDLRASGVRGVMRTEVIAAARTAGITVEECALWPNDVERADEVFVTNALRGLRPVVQLEQRRWSPGAIMETLQSSLFSTYA
ncbi:MAG: aminodeoxychorismate lyase [Steroidobacteraceae bacterium]